MTEIKDLALEVECIEDNSIKLTELVERLQLHNDKEKKLILDYPTVYVHNWKNSSKYEVYVGETNDIVKRTTQHFDKQKNQKAWEHHLLDKKDAKLFIIGHEHFNKSLTLDIENKLIEYMLCVDSVERTHNQKGNPQNHYYPYDELDAIFKKIWHKLGLENKLLFPDEAKIKASAIFKASPLHRLTSTQLKIQEAILSRVKNALDKNNQEKQLILVKGDTGTGKTVLTSSTFCEIYNRFGNNEEDGDSKKPTKEINCCLMVNQAQQLIVYKQIVKKLGLVKTSIKNVVSSPTTFINKHTPKNPVDVAFVDEAHLLLTQKTRYYKGDNQLQDIMDRAKVTVVMYDPLQVLTREQFCEKIDFERFAKLAQRQGNELELNEQLRMQADEKTIEWVDKFTKECKVSKIPHECVHERNESKNYEIKIFDSPKELDSAIREKSKNKNTSQSRLIATFDWKYSEKLRPKNNQENWEVQIVRENESWHKPWNFELERHLTPKEKKDIKDLTWVEQKNTINEVGSTFTIHGIDLNYAGVILGPSVKYQDGKIVFEPNNSKNKKAISRRTMPDGTKKSFGEELIQHEVRILMTRGVNGLYIYACDDDLRKALKIAAMV